MSRVPIRFAKTPAAWGTTAFREVAKAEIVDTDEASALEKLCLVPKLVESDMSNLKVTDPRRLEATAWWSSNFA
jgi:2-C-methyl-D-erythritol 4-phosphate cytidylyltransferase